jgi:hypothetical protein
MYSRNRQFNHNNPTRRRPHTQAQAQQQAELPELRHGEQATGAEHLWKS